MPQLITISQDDRKQLLALARQSIAFGLKHGKPLSIELKNYSEQLQAMASSFVTITKPTSGNAHNLRGCIGSLQATQALASDVAKHAFAAAFNDPRFPPLTNNELEQIHLEISVLTPETEIFCSSEENLLQQLQAGVDGLTIRDGFRQATFLPSVWEQLPSKKDFLLHLKRKAGLADDYWSGDIQAFRYRTVSFEE